MKNKNDHCKSNVGLTHLSIKCCHKHQLKTI